jgi:succinate-semialdehyde dehydrogenase/glutarate-semialdehyde dehydrogenase
MAFTSINPATGEVYATFEEHDAAEVDRRLSLAKDAFEQWKHVDLEQRARLMTTAAELLESELPVQAEAMTREMGKTFAAAKGEAGKCAMTMRYYAEHAATLLADRTIVSSGSRSGVRYEPIGPVLAVMPWNFPLWQVIRFAAPTLMAGNVVVLKHASNVPNAAIAMENLFRRAGFPEGCFVNLLIGSKRVADVIRDERIAAVTLTGSEAAGESVASIAGSVLKKCVLELGGSDPFVVAQSVDMDLAVPMAVTARTQNNGQACIAAKRFIVVESRAEEFTERFSAAMGALVVGDPMDPATNVGPLATKGQLEETRIQVAESVAKGAIVTAGGKALDGPGYYYEPTVLTNITGDMPAGCQEMFGPVAAVYVASDLAHAVAIANDTPWGLGASIWATDDAEQRYGLENLSAGMVFANQMVSSMPELPFGGIGRSGYGRELSDVGMYEFCNQKSFYVA